MTNTGREKSDILQNQFTAYLKTSIQRERKNYIKRLFEYSENNILTGETSTFQILSCEINSEKIHTLEHGISNPILFDGISKLNSIEALIIKLKILNDLTFVEISQKMNISAKSIASCYYRILLKLRRILEAENERF